MLSRQGSCAFSMAMATRPPLFELNLLRYLLATWHISWP
jgi:hypothetical protein